MIALLWVRRAVTSPHLGTLDWLKLWEDNSPAL